MKKYEISSNRKTVSNFTPKTQGFCCWHFWDELLQRHTLPDRGSGKGNSFPYDGFISQDLVFVVFCR